MGQWIPINPGLTNGAFSALSHLPRASELKPMELQTGQTHFGTMWEQGSSLSLSAASRLGLSGVVDTSSSYSSHTITYDVALYSEIIDSVPNGGVIYGTRWGAGLRARITVFNLDVSIDLKIGVVAAAASLGLVNASYEIEGMGISDRRLLALLPGPGRFDAKGHAELMGAIRGVVAEVLVPKKDLSPVPFMICVSNAGFFAPPIERARSFLAGVRAVAYKNPLKSVLTDAERALDPIAIETSYRQLCGDLLADSGPPPESVESAKKWLSPLRHQSLVQSDAERSSMTTQAETLGRLDSFTPDRSTGVLDLDLMSNAAGALSFGLDTATVADLKRFHVSQQYFSLKSQVDLNIGSYGSGGSSLNRCKLVYECMIESEPEQVRIDRAVWERVAAVGVRVEVDVEIVQSKFKADIFSVAAAVEMGYARASFSTMIFPAEAAALKAMIPDSGPFNIEQYDKILEGVARAKEELSKLQEVKPQLYHRPSHFVFTGKEELAEAQSAVYAAVRLVQVTRLADAVHDGIKAGFDENIIREAYRFFWPEVTDDAKPPAGVRTAAGKWLGW